MKKSVNSPSPFEEYYRECFPAELREAVADAANGEFSRYWQLGLQRQYEIALSSGYLSPKCVQLWDILQCVLARVPQWSNEEEESASARKSGSTLLFFAEDPNFRTFAEIIRTAPRDYYATAIIDFETPESERPAAAQHMKRCLERWLSAQEIPPETLALPAPDTILMQDHYPTLRQAAASLLAALNEPTQLEG